MIGEGEINNSNNQYYSNSLSNLNPIQGNINEEEENENEMENNFDNENEENFQEQNMNLIKEEGDFEQDDVYMMELHRKLAMMKQERKLAEKDSHLLHNRLRLLKNEEEKVIEIFK